MKQLKLKNGSYNFSGNFAEFTLERSFSFIKINSIILDTLCDKSYIDNWIGKLMDNKVKLIIEYSSNTSSKTIEHNFIMDVTGYHQVPVFNYTDWYLPQENVRNISEVNYFNKLKISLHANHYDFKATIIYEESPGVKLLNQNGY
jgi:hypothetical protein